MSQRNLQEELRHLQDASPDCGVVYNGKSAEEWYTLYCQEVMRSDDITNEIAVEKNAKKTLARWECVVTEVDGDTVWCDAYPLGQASIEREFWEMEVPDNEWSEGIAFYVVKLQSSC